MSQFPGGTVLTDLAEVIQKVGYKVMTADIYLSLPDIPESAFMVTELMTPYTNELLRKGVTPAVCTCFESPIIAYDFYHALSHYAGRYEHVFLFGGAGLRLKDTRTQFHSLFWPNSLRQVKSSKPWPQRALITLINSNKRAFQFKEEFFNFKHPRSSLRHIYHYLISIFTHYFDPWMRSELYLERLRAIEHFSHISQFDLYGQGWNAPMQGFYKRFNKSIRSAYRGTIPAGTEQKLKVLEKYKFVLCFENTAFPGYITEKLFDSFFAGCIPIYYGAPDITKLVPLNTFIDFRNFPNYRDLEEYLLLMSNNEVEGFRKAAVDFLASSDFEKFTNTTYIKQILSALDDSIKRHV